MGATKERFQNPVAGDLLLLKLYAYNSNNLSDFYSVDKVEIYFNDPDEKTEENPIGKRLVTTVQGSDIQRTDVGTYLSPLQTSSPLFVIGQYEDVWYVHIDGPDNSQKVVNTFQLYPELWYASPNPIVYDFNFQFRPNKIRHGSVKYLSIEVIPNVPNATDLARYYEQLAIVTPLTMSMELVAGDCIPAERDLRLVLDQVPVTLRDGRMAYYLLDTTQLEHGVYDVFFTLQFGSTTHISDKNQLQIY